MNKQTVLSRKYLWAQLNSKVFRESARLNGKTDIPKSHSCIYYYGGTRASNEYCALDGVINSPNHSISTKQHFHPVS